MTSNGWKVTSTSEIFETGGTQKNALPRRGDTAEGRERAGGWHREPQLSTAIALSGGAVDKTTRSMEENLKVYQNAEE